MVPHNVHAQQVEEDINDALVHENEQDEPSKDDGSEGLEATGTDPAEPDDWFCTFSMHGDYVHKSFGDASGHGWWVNGDCEATQAIVTVQLQQYINGSWVDAGSPGSKIVYSGGGSANRAVARASCNTSTWTWWRSEIDVDLIGIPDTPGKYYTSPQDLTCRH